MQLKAAPVGRGTFADRRCDNACSSQVAKIRPGAKGQTPAASPHYAHASPASPAPASPTSTRKATAVDREVERIVSNAIREIDLPENSKDDIFPDIATFVLIDAYKTASSGLSKQKFLDHPEIQKRIDRIVTTATRSGKDGPHFAFIALNANIERKRLDQALKNALLTRIFKDNTLVNLLRDTMPPEEQRALDDLLLKERFKKLPREIQLEFLCQISIYPDKRNVIHYLGLLINKREFLEPPDRKFALADQHELTRIIATAAGSADGHRRTLDQTLDYILVSPGVKLVLHSFKGEADGDFDNGIVRLNRGDNPKWLALDVLPHEEYHGEHPAITADGSISNLKDEIGAGMKGYLGGHKKLPSRKEVYLDIRDRLLKAEIYQQFWKPSKNGGSSARFMGIAQVVGKLVGLEKATPYDIHIFDSKFQNSVAHLSTEPMSLEDIKTWLGEEWVKGLRVQKPSEPLSRKIVDDWLANQR